MICSQWLAPANPISQKRKSPCHPSLSEKKIRASTTEKDKVNEDCSRSSKLKPDILSANYIFAFAFGIGIAAGLRSLTAPAVVSWAACFGLLTLRGSSLAFMGSIVAVTIFSLLAIGELVGDLMPQMPKRTAPLPLLARILMGGLCGACLCASANQSLLIGAILGGIGGVIGAFGGYEIRRRLVSKLNIKDILIAIFEDLIALGLACFLVSR